VFRHKISYILNQKTTNITLFTELKKELFFRRLSLLQSWCFT